MFLALDDAGSGDQPERLAGRELNRHAGIPERAISLLLAMLHGRADEGPEERMWLQRLRLEFRMELAPEIPGMVRDLADFDVHSIRRLASEFQATDREDVFVFTIELVAVAVTFADFRVPYASRAKLPSASWHG